MLTAISESIGCSGLSAGATDPKSDTAEVFGCSAGYEYRACAGVALAANVTQNPCTLDGEKCGPAGLRTGPAAQHCGAGQSRTRDWCCL